MSPCLLTKRRESEIPATVFTTDNCEYVSKSTALSRPWPAFSCRHPDPPVLPLLFRHAFEKPPLNETRLGPRQLPFLRRWRWRRTTPSDRVRSPSLTVQKSLCTGLCLWSGVWRQREDKLLLMRLLWYLARNPQTQLSISRRAPMHAWFRVLKSGFDLNLRRIAYLGYL